MWLVNTRMKFQSTAAAATPRPPSADAQGGDAHPGARDVDEARKA